MKSLVVNLFAGPSSGKSTTASGIFYELKNRGINAELTGEYAKDLTWGKRHYTLLDQVYVFGKQQHRVWMLNDEVDVIICDSPILMSLAYAPNYPECFSDLVKWSFDQYDNFNFFIKRVKPYNPKGRNQTEEEAKEKDQEIRDILNYFNQAYEEVPGNDDGKDIITQRILEKIQL